MKNKFMQEALNQAKIAFELDEVPIGAVVVENGQIIAKSHNSNRTNIDPSGHAEILALRDAAQIKGLSRLDQCDLYVTLEPCNMCAGAISLARIKNLYYALPDPKFGAVENGTRFFSHQSCQHKPQIYSNIAEEESKNLLQDFFKKKRD